MVIRALFTLADIVNSNVKEKRLTRLLHDRGIDENTISQAIAAVGYLSLSERDKSNMYRKNPNLDKTDLENKMMAVLLYIFQDLEVAELVIGNKEKAIQASNEARARFARIEAQGDKNNKTVLSLSQGEARIVWFSIINYVDKLTMSDEERKELRKFADFMKIKTDPISSGGDISLHVSNDILTSLDAFLHFFKSDSENASIYGSIGADSFIGDTGVRLSEMTPYIHLMEG